MLRITVDALEVRWKQVFLSEQIQDYTCRKLDGICVGGKFITSFVRTLNLTKLFISKVKFLELASTVLKEAGKPLSASQIWRLAESKGYTSLLETKGKTPEYTLSARLYSAVNDASNDTFGTIGERPKLFFLKNVTPVKAVVEPSETQSENDVRPKSKFKEKDLHCVLAYFIRTSFDAFPKTINHSASKKKEFGEWLHPDMVACYFPRSHWKTNVYELSEMLGDAQLGLFSFEIKQRLSFGNLRESFFQAVSNSSWAHEGYLVAAEISRDKDFLDELSRLSNSFGIGVILLDVEDPDDSEVLFEAEQKEKIDWDTVNKLSSMNSDFNEFINRVRRDVSSKEVREEWYDEFLEAEEIVRRFKSR